jgi:hypothetical protein
MADQNVLDAEIEQLVDQEGLAAMPPGFSICEEAYVRAALPRPWVSESGLGTSPLDLFIGGILQSAGITVEVMKKHAVEEGTALYQAVQILEKHDIVEMMKVTDPNMITYEGQHARRPGCAPRQLHLEADRGEREQGGTRAGGRAFDAKAEVQRRVRQHDVLNQLPVRDLRRCSRRRPALHNGGLEARHDQHRVQEEG